MLLPEYVGLKDPAGPMRERCVEALSAALHEPNAACDLVVVVTGRDPSTRSTKRSLGLRIAEHLLARAGWAGPVEEVVVPFDADSAMVAEAGRALASRAERILLLAVGDGSARRDEKAPGHFDPRAQAFDTALLSGLDRADARALIGLDAGLGAELLATGRAALQVMAHAVLGGPGLRRALLWSDAPYGVLYALSVWTSPTVHAT